MTRDDLFNTNASIVRDLAAAVARVSPSAHILVISNPVNSTVPIVASTLEKAGVLDPRRLYGVTTLDVVRSQRFLASIVESDPEKTPVHVVGGHSGPTIVPLISQTAYANAVTGDQYEKLVHRIQFGGDEVVKAKDGAGSATLSMAYAGAKFAGVLLKALNGEKGLITPTFVKSPLFADQGIDFFSSPVEFGVSFIYLLIGVLLITSILCSPTALRRFILSVKFLLRRRSFLKHVCPNSRRTLRKEKLLLRRLDRSLDIDQLAFWIVTYLRFVGFI